MSRHAPHLNHSIKILHEFAVELAQITVAGTWRDAVKAAQISRFFQDEDERCLHCGGGVQAPRNGAERMLLAISHLQGELDAARIEEAREKLA